MVSVLNALPHIHYLLCLTDRVATIAYSADTGSARSLCDGRVMKCVDSGWSGQMRIILIFLGLAGRMQKGLAFLTSSSSSSPSLFPIDKSGGRHSGEIFAYVII